MSTKTIVWTFVRQGEGIDRFRDDFRTDFLQLGDQALGRAGIRLRLSRELRNKLVCSETAKQAHRLRFLKHQTRRAGGGSEGGPPCTQHQCSMSFICQSTRSCPGEVRNSQPKNPLRHYATAVSIQCYASPLKSMLGTVAGFVTMWRSCPARHTNRHSFYLIGAAEM